MGRIAAWDELSLFGIWAELSLGTNRRLGRIVAQPVGGTLQRILFGTALVLQSAITNFYLDINIHSIFWKRKLYMQNYNDNRE